MKQEMIERKTWDEYFLDIAETVKTRSTCLSRQVGAVIVMDKRILATGYNGAPVGVKHCDENGCIRRTANIKSGERLDYCKAVHAEQNAVAQAAKYGISINGASIYVTVTPCLMCTKLLINSGIKNIIYAGDYPTDEMSFELLEEAGVTLKKIRR